MWFSQKGRSGFRAALFLLISILAAAQSEALARKSVQAKQLMSEGRFAEAVPICQELVRALPGNPGLRLNLGLALQMSGRSREAIPEFEKVLKADPNSLPALLSLASARLVANDPAKAIAPLQKAVELDPQNPNSRGMFAAALLGVGRAKEAAFQYRKLTAIVPGDPKAWQGLGRAYETLAQQSYEELSKTSGGSPEWLSLLADSRIVRRQYRSAFYFYKQALEKNPSFQPAIVGIADVYRATNHADWASTQEKKAQALGPVNCVRAKPQCDFEAARFLNAANGTSAYWRTRAYNELARQSYARLGSLPETVEVHTVRAEIASNQGQYLEAAKEWRAAMKLAPDDPRLEQQLALSLQSAGDHQAALPIFEKFLRAEPDNAELNFFVGEALLRLEQAAKAEPYLEKAARLDPQLLPAQASLGLTYVRLGKGGEAIPHLEAALSIDTDGSLHYQLARAYQSAGNPEKAKEMMAQYQAIQAKSKETEQSLETEAEITAPSPRAPGRP